MNAFSRPRLRSTRARMRRIDKVFEKIFYVLLVVVFFYTLTGMLSEREVFHIAHIEVLGAEATGDARVRDVAHELLSQKLFWRIKQNNAVFYPKQALSKAIYELDAHVAQVSLSVEPYHTLNITIREYQPSILWCTGISEGETASTSESCYLASDEGYVYANAPSYSGYPFIVFRSGIAGMEEEGTPIGLFVLPENDFMQIKNFRSALRGRGVIVREVSQMGEGDYRLETDDGTQIEWSVRRDPAESAENLSAALLEMGANAKKGVATTTPSIIDLRFEDKIFYK